MSEDPKNNVTEISVNKKVAVTFVSPDNLHGHFANQMIVQQDADCAYLTFFHCAPPTPTGTMQEMSRDMANLSSVNANFVSQVIIPRHRLEDFANALLNHAAKGNKSQSK